MTKKKINVYVQATVEITVEEDNDEHVVSDFYEEVWNAFDTSVPSGLLVHLDVERAMLWVSITN